MDSHPHFALAWNQRIVRLADPHFLQTWEWAQIKAQYGWTPFYLIWTETDFFFLSQPTIQQDQSSWQNALEHSRAACLVLKRSLPIRGMAARLSLLYAPKGPLVSWSDARMRQRVLDDLQMFGRQQGAIFLKCDPDVLLGTGIPNTLDATEDPLGPAVQADLMGRGWHFSPDQIQFRNTIWLDLTLSEETLSARMKPKTRYNIRLAEKKGVCVRLGGLDDFPLLYRMYAETSLRDGFTIREEGYYRTVWETLLRHKPAPDRPYAVPLIAEVEGEAVAGLFLVIFAGRAYYLYGMSRAIHREKMPNHLLQWEAIRHARSAGCTRYDLWGAPEVFQESDPLWGVFRFKQGFGGQVIRTLGAWDYAPHPLWYRLYTEVMPRLLDVMRRRGRSQTRQALS